MKTCNRLIISAILLVGISTSVSKATFFPGELYIPIPKPGEWSDAGGRRTNVSVGSDETVLGVDKNNLVYRLYRIVWKKFPGLLVQISVGSAEHIWGVNKHNNVYFWQNDKWNRVENLKLKNVAVNADGTVWGCKIDDTIVTKSASDTEWKTVPGRLVNVSIGSDGTVWGVNRDDLIFRRDGDSWTRIPGLLKQISVGSAEHVWGVNKHNNVYFWENDKWNRVEDLKLKNVSVNSNGTVYGCKPDDTVVVRVPE